MKRFFTLLTILITCMSLFATVAEAKRFGGGSSFGKQRSMPYKQVQKSPEAAPQQAPQPQQPNRNRWLGPLAGLAVGAGLASMFAGGGLGGMANILGPILLAVVIGLVLMVVMSRFKKSQPAGVAYAGLNPAYAPPPSQQAYSGGGAAFASASNNSIPADFPVESFLRNGKASFIRLQAANDRKDKDDVREYTTPEMFAEIAMQMQERHNTPQVTDVISLNAELLEVATEGDYTIASVRFIAQLSENKGAIENVDEIWHVQKNDRDPKAVWLLAGIQQRQFQ